MVNPQQYQRLLRLWQRYKANSQQYWTRAEARDIKRICDTMYDRGFPGTPEGELKAISALCEKVVEV